MPLCYEHRKDPSKPWDPVSWRAVVDGRARILITGAAGNLGSLLAMHLVPGGHDLRLMFHRRPIRAELAAAPNVTCVQADLADVSTLLGAVEGIDTVVHFAGILFAPRPTRFLPETNTRWFANLLEASVRTEVRRIILISFPHVEGRTTVDDPATGRLDRRPVSVHAETRLQEERLLFERTRGTDTTPIVLRLGLVYGSGILMIEAARWLARRRLLGVWREPTWIHLLSTADFLRATKAALLNSHANGIYQIGDEQPVTLQHFLDEACRVWRCPPPWRMPFPLIMGAASACELFALIARTPSPLTRDFIRIGRVPFWGDTRRARAELIPELVYPTLNEGLTTLLSVSGK